MDTLGAGEEDPSVGQDYAAEPQSPKQQRPRSIRTAPSLVPEIQQQAGTQQPPERTERLGWLELRDALAPSYDDLARAVTRVKALVTSRDSRNA